MTSTTTDGREVLARVSDAYVGRAADGGRLFLTLELRRTVRPAGHPAETVGPATETFEAPAGADADPGETVTRVRHVTTGEYLSVSVVGAYIAPRSRRHDVDSAGQNIDDFRETSDDRYSHWTADDRASALAIWEAWHLNDMRAGCAHVPTPEWETDPRYGYRRPDLVNTPACPETGYRYGHAWLVDPLPEDVATEVRRLCSIPRGAVPAWLDS